MYAYMFTHPGKKLNFMGGEFAQFREWDETREQDWDILKYPLHESFDRYMKKLMGLYKTEPALHNAEYNSDTFRWLMADNAEQCSYAYIRTAENQTIWCLFNFSDKEQTFPLNADKPCVLSPLLSSDEQTYSGSTPEKELKNIAIEKAGAHEFTLPPFTAVLYEELPAEPAKPAKTAKKPKSAAK